MINNEQLYVTKDETFYNTTRTRTWAYGLEKNYHYTGLQRPFTVTSEQEGDNCVSSPEHVTLTVNGTGIYGGNLRPLEFYLDKEDIGGLIKMLSEVNKSMK